MRSAETPNLGGLDSTDDVRPGIGLDGLGALRDWVAAGGVLITEGGTAAVFTDYGVTRGVDITPARQLRASGGIYRAVTRDPKSPIAYGYADTLAVYFNQSPLFQVDTSTEVPEDQDPDLTREQARARPRVVMGFHQKRDSLRLSGLLVAGEELAGRPAVPTPRWGRDTSCCLRSGRSGGGRRRAASPWRSMRSSTGTTWGSHGRRRPSQAVARWRRRTKGIRFPQPVG